MSIDGSIQPEVKLEVPDEFLPNEERNLPELSGETLVTLGGLGWKRVGLLVAVIDEVGDVMMLAHNATEKNDAGALGPLSETTKFAGPYVEQPLQTLHRGIGEELGVELPAELNLAMLAKGGWTINQWPVGKKYPNEFAFGISFPVFIPRAAQLELLGRPHGTEEAAGIHFMSADTILGLNDSELRPGVKGWLQQLIDTELLDAQQSQLAPIDFSNLFEAGLHDVRL